MCGYPTRVSSLLTFIVVGRTCSSLKSRGILWRPRSFRPCGHALSFEGVAGNFDQTRPGDAQPWGGLMEAIKWSRTRGEAKQRELVGMTAYAEAGAVDLSLYVGMAEAKSFETEAK